MVVNSESTLIAEIQELKKRQRAVVLAHNYQRPEIYRVADFIGDSLELARQAQGVASEVIVFCGVQFMAETAKVLNPDRKVILAQPKAGCEMARMITVEALQRRRSELGEVTVVAYVNTPVDVKAEADICCTSANAAKVINSLPEDRAILFVPDKHLAAWVMEQTGRELIPWDGFCYVHAFFTVEDVQRARVEHPGAAVVVHPECPLAVCKAADEVCSTSGMLKLAARYDEMVLGTEVGMCERIRLVYPEKRCYPLRRIALCRNMKLTRLSDVRAALLGQVPEIVISEDIVSRARLALLRMLEIS